MGKRYAMQSIVIWKIQFAFQITEEMEALDKQSKKILKYREVLAVILKETVEEYQGYSEDEIMEFIEADSITESSRSFSQAE